jgi:iron(III) transport system permease protein
LKPALLTGSLLVALYTLSDFGGVSIVRYNTFTLSIYNAYRSLFDRSMAAGLSTVLVFGTLLLIGIQAFLLKRCRPNRNRASSAAVLIPLGAWKVPTQIALGTVALLNLGLPITVIFYWGMRAVVVGNQIGGAWSVALGSLGVSSLAAVCAVLLSIPLATLAIRYPSARSRLLDRLAHSGYALPGIVIALSLVFCATRYLLPLYQSMTLLIVAYVIRFLPEALAASKASIMRVAPVFEEAARTLGTSRMSVLWRVTLPMIKPGLLTGAGLVFLTAMKELPATLILRPTGFETLATKIWGAASEGIYSQAAAPAFLLLAVSGPPLYWLILRPALGSLRGDVG